MANLAEVQVLPGREIEGGWVLFDKEIDSWVRIARMGNSDHTRFLNKQAQQQVRGFRAGSKQAEKAGERIDIEARARYVVRDWHNIENANGPLEPTLQNKAGSLALRSTRTGFSCSMPPMAALCGFIRNGKARSERTRSGSRRGSGES